MTAHLNKPDPSPAAFALRGEGVLITLRGEIRVRYGIDVSDKGGRRRASGWIKGAAAFGAIKSAGLRLASGLRLEITLEAGDQDGASVEVVNADAIPLAIMASAALAVRAPGRKGG
jgi:hypothetical protein